MIFLKQKTRLILIFRRKRWNLMVVVSWILDHQAVIINGSGEFRFFTNYNKNRNQKSIFKNKSSILVKRYLPTTLIISSLRDRKLRGKVTQLCQISANLCLIHCTENLAKNVILAAILAPIIM